MLQPWEESGIPQQNTTLFFKRIISSYLPSMLTYNARLKAVEEGDEALLFALLKMHREVVNEASKMQFDKQLMGLKELHEAFYYGARERFPDVPSQVVIKAEQECVARYSAMKSNRQKPSRPFEKRSLSLRLDKRISSRTKTPTRINIITTEKRKLFDIVVYPKLKAMMAKHEWSDPLIFVRNGRLMISLSFEVAVPQREPENVLGVDLGIRRVAACSDGRLFIDREFNREKRKLRYLKRQLQAKGTPSARRHRRKLLGKERNMNRNQSHLIANAILRTDASCIALENLSGIKAKKHKFQNKNRISQVPLFDLRRILTYKAMNAGKSVRLVSPAYTSQDDSISGKRDGIRKGCRYYAASGKVYDADLNAASNIARRAKLPFSNGGSSVILDGQGVVNRPIACQPLGPKGRGSIASQRLSVIGG